MKHARTSRSWLSAFAAILAAVAAAPAGAMMGAPNEGAWLGVGIQDVSPALRQHFPGAPASGGVLVNRVLPDTPAERAGVEPGDVILELDQQRLESAEELRQRISRSRPGTDALLLVQRGAETHALTAHLVKKPDSLDLGDRVPRWQDLEIPWSRWFILGEEGGLGARMAEMNDGLARYIPGTGGKGVLVLEVCSGSPAAAASLESGDVIVAAEGSEVADIADLRHELRQAREPKASVEYVRNGARQSTKIELRTGEECWKDSGRSFFHLRPGSPSFRLLPDAEGKLESQ